MSAQYAVSDTGTIVYTTGGAAAAQDRAPMTSLARDGTRAVVLQGPSWRNVAASPDGTQLAFEGGELNAPSDIVIYDRRTERSRGLTLDPNNDYSTPVWSPDGTRIAFASRPKSKPPVRFNLYWRNADGSGPVHRLTTADAHQFPGGWHPSGKWIVYHEIKEPGSGDIMALPVSPDGDDLRAGTPEPLAATESIELNPAISSDGQWISYTDSKTRQVLVRPFRGTDGPWPVSTEGGTYSSWSPTRHELLFQSVTGLQVMSAAYETAGRSIRFAKPQRWPGAVLGAGGRKSWTMAADGEHLIGGLSDPVADQSVMVAMNALRPRR